MLKEPTSERRTEGGVHILRSFTVRPLGLSMIYIFADAVIYGLFRLAVVSYHSYVQVAVVQFNFLPAGFVPSLEDLENVPRS